MVSTVRLFLKLFTLHILILILIALFFLLMSLIISLWLLLLLWDFSLKLYLLPRLFVRLYLLYMSIKDLVLGLLKNLFRIFAVSENVVFYVWKGDV